MPVAADLQLFASANDRDADTGVQGGAIDLNYRPDFTQIAANDDIEVISSSASDTQNCTIEARDTDGALTSQTAALTGTTAKVFNTLGGDGVVERVLKVELASDAIGTITVRRSVAGATLRTIPIGEQGFRMFFRKTASDPGSGKTYYAKLHWKNTHGSQALTGAQVKQNADPTAKITHLLAASKGDSATSTNRITAPGAADTQDPDTFNDTDKSVPGTDLGAGESIGVWFALALTAGDSPIRSTYTSELTGSSV